MKKGRNSAARQGWAGAAGGSESGASAATFHDPSACVPPGRWRGDDGTVVVGPASLEIEAPLDRLPWYRRIRP